MAGPFIMNANKWSDIFLTQLNGRAVYYAFKKMVEHFLNTKNGRTVYCEYKQMVGPFLNTNKWPVRLL